MDAFFFALRKEVDGRETRDGGFAYFFSLSRSRNSFGVGEGRRILEGMLVRHGLVGIALRKRYSNKNGVFISEYPMYHAIFTYSSCPFTTKYIDITAISPVVTI